MKERWIRTGRIWFKGRFRERIENSQKWELPVYALPFGSWSIIPHDLQLEAGCFILDEASPVGNVNSMTGYAVVVRESLGGTLTLDIRTVNHRYLDIQFRIPDLLRPVEQLLRERIAARVRRGKVDCRIDWRKPHLSLNSTALNIPALEQLHSASTVVQEAFPEATPLSIGEILQWPGILGDTESAVPTWEQECLPLVESALTQLSVTRSREGERLGTFVQEHCDQARVLITALTPKLPSLVQNYRHKLALKVQESGITADPERLLQEVVLFATRIDVEEELSRLALHLDEVERVVKDGGQIGKRLDFLMQELNREANTLGSKAAASEVTQAALGLKVLIEKMREQVQNIE